jgi:hypothetical protein
MERFAWKTSDRRVGAGPKARILVLIISKMKSAGLREQADELQKTTIFEVRGFLRQLHTGPSPTILEER